MRDAHKVSLPPPPAGGERDPTALGQFGRAVSGEVRRSPRPLVSSYPSFWINSPPVVTFLRILPKMVFLREMTS